MKKFILALTFLACSSMSADIWNGSADVSWYSEDAQAFNLTTPEQLAGLAKLVNSGNSFEGKIITLGADVFLNDTTGYGDGTWSKKKLNAWTPIGTASNPFKGEFKSSAGTKNRKIYGLYVNSASDYAGLFGCISGTTISNLDLLVGSVKGSNYVGSIVGKSLEANITNVYAEVPVSGKDYVGGIAGFGYSVSNSSHIGDVNGANRVGGLAGALNAGVSDSYSEGNVTGTGRYIGGLVGSLYVNENDYGLKDADVYSVVNSHAIGKVKGDDYVGGLIGFDSVTVSSTLKRLLISKSYSLGTVEGDNVVGGFIGELKKTSAVQIVIDSCYHDRGNVVGTSDFVGGLAGEVMVTITNSYSKGAVSGHDYVGGLVGANQGDGIVHSNSDSIYNSYSEGRVVGRVDVGGLVGFMNGAVSKSYAKGDSVIGYRNVGGLLGYAYSNVDSSYAVANVKGDDNVGGLVGSAQGNISKSYALGNVNGDEDNSSAGNENLGGLVGYQYNGSVARSFAVGDVSGTTKIGGLVGRFDGAQILKSYANGNVTGLNSKTKDAGNIYIGGLVGYGKGTLEETYASGAVKGMEKNPVFTGCLVGYVNGNMTISKSYYDATVCGLGVEGVDELGNVHAVVDNTPAQTTAAMRTKDSYSQWDFVVDWDILKDSYPYLRYYAVSSSSIESSSSSVVVSSSSILTVSSSSILASSSSAAIENRSSDSKSSSSTVKSSSSSVKNSSSSAKSSSSKAKSSNSAKSSSSVKGQAIPFELATAPLYELNVSGRELQITGVHAGSSIRLFDMQGHVLMNRMVTTSSFNVRVPQAGRYIVCIDRQSRVVNIK